MPARDLTPPGVASTKAANTNAGETSVKLYGYFRSSAAYRVRIALNLKNLSAEQQSVHLTRNGGWQWSEDYRALNPQKRVPALVLDDGKSCFSRSRSSNISTRCIRSRRCCPAIRSNARRCAPFRRSWPATSIR